ncbi:HCO3- transporter family domain-containing protein [Ditylenchus destructor]|uniref:HCO3- transporter family domain-containing protein n=1 Tax=Ditylenchus destructor TaxID=166010 RepID=A0AAD4QSH9_9BILA|nr:HCO3- transporter family domain-containing protein [Ditylenchus destructor]
MMSEGKFRGRRASQFSAIASMRSGYSSTDDENSTKYEDADERLLKRLPADIDAAVILVAKVNGLKKALSIFIRLTYTTLLYPEIPDHPIPVKFLFILLSPVDNYANEARGIGRAMGALFSDEIFQKVAYCAMEKYTIANAVEEFFSQVVVVPPGKCHPDTRWQPKENETEARSVGMLYANYETPDDVFAEDEDEFEKEKADGKIRPSINPHQPVIFRSGRCFGGLIQDVKRKSKWYRSDYVDFFRGRLSQSLAATISIFFANISNIITFGAVMERALNHQMAAIENIVCGGLCGIVFGLFSGQPLNIISATGPTLVFEKILYDFCTQRRGGLHGCWL